MTVGGIGNWLDPVRGSLDEERAPVDLFIRDDDVGWDDKRLWQLLDLIATHALPADLAVIPSELSESLARSLLARSESAPHSLSFHQHGFAHVNHELTGRKYEFGPSRRGWLQRRDIVEGRRRLGDLLGASVDPIFTPPWNRCTRTTGRFLVDLGFEVLSREARAMPLTTTGLVELPATNDWFARRKQRRLSHGEFGEQLARSIESRGTIGLMLHHAVMNRDERDAAGELLALLAGHDRVRAHGMLELARLHRSNSTLATEVER
jgi:peptidoglycan/xylan/chitin deacetylase (PgdA/CDA1 family)